MQLHRQRRRHIAASQLQPVKPSEHGEVDATKGERESAGLHRIVDAAFLLEQRGPLGLQRRRARGYGAPGLLREKIKTLQHRQVGQREQKLSRGCASRI